LARRGQLSTFLRRLFPELDVSDEPELYLWGLKISLDGPVPKEQFDALCAARKVFESGIHKMNTEPDIMLYAPNRFLVLVEAKFTSPNTTVRPGAADKPKEKPKTRKGILDRYSVDQLPPGSLLAPTDETPLFSQLYRNLVFAIYMAKQLKVQWGFVNLTSQRAYKKMSDDVTAFSNAVLPPESRHRFVRCTWEQLFRDHVEGKADLDELATYMRHKSANCVQAFGI